MDSPVLSSTDPNEEQDIDLQDGDSDADGWTTSDSDEPAAVLCRRCRNIDFAKAFESDAIITELERHNGTYHGLFIANVNWYSPSCALCNLLDDTVEKFYGPLDHKFILRAYAHPELYTQFKTVPPHAYEFLQEVFWILPVPPPKSTVTWELKKISWDSATTGWLGCYITEGSPRILRPRMVSRYFDTKLALDWTAACQRLHPNTCDEIVESIPDLSLIDVTTLEVSQFPTQPPPYVALSYVWAPPLTTSSTPPLSPSTPSALPPWPTLSLVVQDAITATRALSHRYLWIDKYCIAQHDPRTRLSQIDAMHLIYGAASLTLIAAAGPNEHHGLPGVRRPRKSNRIAEVGRVSLIRHPQLFRDARIESRWASRGWTLQEEHFSHRRVYFFEGYTAFECRRVECSEAVAGLEAAGTEKEVDVYAKTMPTFRTVMEHYGEAGGSAGGRQRLSQLRTLIEDYTRRDLTYAADSLRAFGGAQKSFEEGEFPVYCLRGLPVCFQKELVLGSVDAQLASILCWEHVYPRHARRRREFPSWSWAGWAGGVFMQDFRDLTVVGGCPRDFLIEDVEGKYFSLQNMWNCLNGDADDGVPIAETPRTVISKPVAMGFLTSATALLFDAIVVGEEYFSDISPLYWKIGRVFNLHTRANQFSTRIEEDMPFTPQFLIDGIADGYLGCILLGFMAEKSKEQTRAHLLLVEWHDEGPVRHARRIAKVSAESEVGEWLDVDIILRDTKWQRIRLS